MEKGREINIIFSIIALLVIIISARVFLKSYVYHDFPIFTDDQQIESMKVDTFGFLASIL